MDERWDDARAAAARGDYKAALGLLRRDKDRAASLADVDGLRAVVEIAAEIRDRAGGGIAADAFLLGKSASDDLRHALARAAAARPQAPPPPSPSSAPARPVAARIDDLERRLRRFQEELAELRALAASEGPGRRGPERRDGVPARPHSRERVLGLIGLALLAVGLRRRWTALRLAGLALFAVALAKIFLFDLRTLSSLARALSFLAVGTVLLFAAFLYQRLTDDRDDDAALSARTPSGR